MRQLFSVAKVQPQCRPQSELFAASGSKTVVLYPAVVCKAERGIQNCEYLCRCCSAALLELYSNCIRMQTKWKVFRISLVCTDLALSWLYSVFCFVFCGFCCCLPLSLSAKYLCAALYSVDRKQGKWWCPHPHSLSLSACCSVSAAGEYANLRWWERKEKGRKEEHLNELIRNMCVRLLVCSKLLLQSGITARRAL